MNLTKSQQFWRNHIIACQESGLSQAQYSKIHGLKKSSFSAQKHYLIKNGLMDLQKNTHPSNSVSNFLEVKESLSQTICLELSSGTKISFETLPDPLWIRKLLGELNASQLR